MRFGPGVHFSASDVKERERERERQKESERERGGGNGEIEKGSVRGRERGRKETSTGFILSVYGAVRF